MRPKKAFEFQPGEIYVVYADGSCLSNGKADAPGGWGFVILDKDEQHVLFENSGAAVGVTNNQMELTAAIEAFESLPKGCYVDVKLDSQYVLKGCNEWLAGWIRKGWKTAGGTPVKNEGLWHRMIQAMEGKKFAWTWVKGHANNRYNERCDKLATTASRSILRK